MFVFYTDNIDASKLSLEGDEARHCIKTLRHKTGDQINVFDASGLLYTAKIIQFHRNEVVCDIMSVDPPKAKNHQITLAIAATKSSDRLEWAISKAVEIGVQQIIIMTTEHTESTRYKLERLKRIMISAAKQSLNLKLPEILERNYEEVVTNFEPDTRKYIAHCEGTKDHLGKIQFREDDQICIMIGPEGDFSINEIHKAREYQWNEVSLGDSRLRTETAAIVALTLINTMLLP